MGPIKSSEMMTNVSTKQPTEFGLLLHHVFFSCPETLYRRALTSVARNNELMGHGKGKPCSYCSVLPWLS